MIKPNWHSFRAKFNDNPQTNFEWFCYLLFCHEFKTPAGLFRYKNQSGIETNPITKDGEVIGWQAKFYDTKLSDNKSDLKEMVAKSKRDYSNLTKIIFYTHQEWGQGKKDNDSEIKKEVDQTAKASGIKIEWRTASFFESLLVTVENEKISKHFFAPDKSIFDLLEEKQRHTENVLLEIKTDIDFSGKKIEIDRGELLDRLSDNLNQKQILIVSGVGGVGKTAVIKKLHENKKDSIPFYVFKASEFNKASINDLFKEYGLQDFADAHREETHKIVVIDSAEKLLDLTNTDPFKEFLTVLIKDNWQIIFTTRNNYLADLNYDFIDIYNIRPGNFDIHNLDHKELAEIAQANGFSLPEDAKLLELIKNPFYLSEYLSFYAGENIDYLNFKEKLWSRIIVKTNPAREQCFLATAFQRANEGQFFVTPVCDAQILDTLVKDGILGYETAGYFITHDIYEEWALEKKIAADYIRKGHNREFFELIGESLPVRRSFRTWVSERLLLEDQSIVRFIGEIIKEDGVAKFWKDELWISVLLSDHSAAFFELFKEELLGNDQGLLKRLTFLLRLACKEVDYDSLKQLGVSDLNLLAIKYVLTKPKGMGWQSAIRFIHDNLDTIGFKNIHFVLSVIHEWNQKVKKGETTRLSSLIAIKYYQWTIEEDVYLSHGDDKENPLQTILHGAATIKPELEGIFGEVLKNRWNNHRDPYYDLMQAILTDIGAFPVWITLPESVLQVADMFWYRPPQEKGYRYHRTDIEDDFCLSHVRHDYFPSSPYQTPIYWLLQFALKKSIDFILAFTNKTVECFVRVRSATNEIQETDVFIENGQFIKQYICDRLWCSYRGTQVSTNLLSSIHMALEKFFVENGKDMDSKTLESWLLYMLRNSKSASISGLVTSIVLAYPEKMFNVAKVLFQTKDFFLFDLSRYMFDKSHKSSLIALRDGFGGPNYKNALHEEDRIKACDEPHRKKCLEHLALNYQYFRSEGTSEEEAKERQQVIWGIFDKYYSQLPEESQETEADKTWRLFLARMDRRKMKATTEVKNEGTVISFNPEIDPKLKEYSEAALKKSSEPMKYTPLMLWARYRKDKDECSKQYEQYENNPQLVLKETKEILERLKQGTDASFHLFNHAIPADVCSILLIEYFNLLSEEEREFCKDITLEYSRVPLTPHYQYQISDGTEAAISALPVIFQNYPAERENIKAILLLTLFVDYPVGMGGDRYSVFPCMAIHKLWKNHFDDMQSLLIGYLLLKPKHEELRKKHRQDNHKKGVYEIDEDQLNEDFFKEHEHDLGKIMENTISIDDLKVFEQTDLYILNTGFQLIPFKTDNAVHKQLTLSIIATFATSLLSRDREDKVDYSVRHAFLEKLAYFVLNASEQDIPDYLKPFLHGFNGSECIAELFEQFIFAEDQLNTYDDFWQVWTLFFEKIVALCKDGDGYWYVDRIIKSYLFAQTPWKETTTDWHTFKDSNSRFFMDIATNTGHCPSTLYSLAKSLNNVASRYLNPGMAWLSGMLTRNNQLWTTKLETDTIYYLESLVRKYIYKNRERIRRTKQLKEEVLVILDFLVEKGSVVGYILRENIL
ncbi:ATP-binding protein [Prosthecochloris sp. SCSIO W1102]|uniref:AVAST type 4 anti-phage nuclease Avs4 n=1 Tax=Prosthecochloris sp. SCSIO W1102 TaxID=2992243 RepID=UPI00223E14BC|nr:AVAST type 4 anti-phage nuclease Avs4 [Prosthecochloris sp. SCSIO W1102]UZJ39556.1 ATP-binding protein [Prosthecochloris sp. SCSIO W1102]